jgi:hypothetical protein
VVVRAIGGCVDNLLYIRGWGVVDTGPIMEVAFRSGSGVCASVRREWEGGVMHFFISGSVVKCFECG